MKKDFGDALDRIEDARKLLSLVMLTCIDQDDNHLKAILIGCEVAREKMDAALSELEEHWHAACQQREEAAA